MADLKPYNPDEDDHNTPFNLNHLSSYARDNGRICEWKDQGNKISKSRYMQAVVYLHNVQNRAMLSLLFSSTLARLS